MSENKQNQAGLGFGIAGLVLGIIALLFSFIPCLGMFAAYPGGLAIIFSIIGLISAFKNNGAKGITIAALVVSVVATAIALFWYFALSSSGFSDGFGDYMDSLEAKEYENCEELLEDFELTVENFNQLVLELESSDKQGDLGPEDTFMVSAKMAKYVAAFSNIQVKIEQMNCSEDPEFKGRIEELQKQWQEMYDETSQSSTTNDSNIEVETIEDTTTMDQFE